MQTLRSRLILSHVLPVLVIIPLAALALYFILQSQLLLGNVQQDLAQQARIIADLVYEQPDIWENVTAAQAFVNTHSRTMRTEIMLIGPKGDPLAWSEDAGPVDEAGVETFMAEQTAVSYTYLESNTTEILMPVRDNQQQLVGIVRLSNQLGNINQRFEQLRLLGIGILGAELLLGVGLGLFLALRLERYLTDVADAMGQVARGRELKPLPETGPDEIRNLLNAFNMMVARLEESQEARRQLLANLVHELGRPLGAVRSALRALLNGADQDVDLRRDLLKGIDSQLALFEPLLDNLLQLHGQITGRVYLKREPVAINTWLEQSISTWRVAAEEKGLDWQQEISAKLPVLSIDADRLSQALGNLLSNAVKYSPPDGTIRLKAGEDDTDFYVMICDEGPGIAPENRERVFEPYFRGQTGRRFPQGMGLGLTIARELVEAHAGSLTIEDLPGQGSCFVIRLPLAEDAV